MRSAIIIISILFCFEAYSAVDKKSFGSYNGALSECKSKLSSLGYDANSCGGVVGSGGPVVLGQAYCDNGKANDGKFIPDSLNTLCLYGGTRYSIEYSFPCPASTELRAFGSFDYGCFRVCPPSRPRFDSASWNCRANLGDKPLEDSCPVYNGNPINARTGEKIQHMSPDFVGEGVFPIQFQRSYKSYRAPGLTKPPSVAQSSGTPSYHMVPFKGQPAAPQRLPIFTNGGYGLWKHNYSSSLFLFDDAKRVLIERSDGSKLYFYSEDGSAFSAEHLTGNSLSKLNDKFVLTLPNGFEEEYGLDGKLLKITNTQGLSHTLTYDNNKLSKIKGPSGRELKLSYDVSGKIISLTDPSANSISFVYDGDENLTGVIYPDATPNDSSDNPTISYEYGNANYPYALSKLTDENNDVNATWTYDASGRAKSSSNNNGYKATEITYEATSAKVKEANGHTKTLTFNSKGQLTSVTGGNCGQCTSSAVSSYTYYSNNLLESETDFNGVITKFEYNDKGLRTKKTEAFGTEQAHVTTTTWHDSLSLPTQVKTSRLQIDYTYGVRGRLEKVMLTDLVDTNNVARTTTYSYNTDGLLSSIDGPRSDVNDKTTITYDSNNDVKTIKNALGHVTTIVSRNSNGYPTSIKDANDIVTSLTYDARNRLTSQKVGSDETLFAYDNVGQLTQITLPSGAVTKYAYNGARLITKVTDGEGNYFQLTYDLMGNITKREVFDPDNTLFTSQQQIFDDLNRLTSITDGVNNKSLYDYDDVGNLTSEKSALLKETKHVYDALNRLIETTDAKSGKTTFAYDDGSNLTSVEAANGAKTTYSYNGFGELTSQFSPDTGTTTFTYDSAGNQISKTDAKGNVVGYSYDSANRLTAIDYADDSLDISLKYDVGTNSKGRLTKVIDGSGSTSFTYNSRGGVASKAIEISGKTFSISYNYNGDDQLTGLTLPSGRVISYTRDKHGRISSISSSKNNVSTVLLSDISYVPFGAAKSKKSGDGQTTLKTHNLNGQVKTLNVGSLYQASFTYDIDNNITGLTDSLIPVNNQSYTYDKLNRLTKATGKYGTLDFEYDKVGNRTSKTNGTQINNYEYTAKSNQLKAPFLHDANGNRSVDYKRKFTYGEHNRLIEVVNQESGLKTKYLYNGLGQRVKKSNLFGDLYFIYDEQGLLVAEANAQGQLVKEYVYFEGQPLAMMVE